MSRRVAVLTNIPAPYRLPLFRLLNSQYDLEVVFDARTEPNRSWAVPQDPGFRHSYTRGLAIPYRRRRSDLGLEDERYLQVRFGLLAALRRIRPEVIISAEMGLRTLQADLYARWAGIPLILWWEGTHHSEGWASEKRRRVRRYLVGRAARFWSNGGESSALLQEYGAAPEQVDEGMIGIDTHRFANAVRAKVPERDSIRREFGLEGTVLLFVGQYVARKGIDEFLKALELIKGPTSVLLIGEGPKREILEKWRGRNPRCNLKIVDFQQPERLPSFYAAADVFVLPTLDDNWSLVALEAAVAGLPQVFSQYNGATHDLLAWGAQGLTVDPCNSETFAAALQTFVDHAPARLPAATADAIADFYSPEACLRRASDSIESAIQSRRELSAGALRSRGASAASADS